MAAAAEVLVVLVAEAGALAVAFSRALVRERTGLFVASLSLRPDGPSVPDPESPEVTRPLPGRGNPPREPTLETRPAAGLVPLGVALGTDTVKEDFRVGLDAGRAGGPMDILAPIVDCRAGFAPTEETREFAGVPVRDGTALDGAVDVSCFVGDLVGLYVALAAAAVV